MAGFLPANVHGVLISRAFLGFSLLETINDCVRHQTMFRVLPHEFINGDCLLLVIHVNVDSQPTAQRLETQATGKAQAGL